MTAPAIVTFWSRPNSVLLDGRPAPEHSPVRVTCDDAGHSPARGVTDVTWRASGRSRTYRTHRPRGRSRALTEGGSGSGTRTTQGTGTGPAAGRTGVGSA